MQSISSIPLAAAAIGKDAERCRVAIGTYGLQSMGLLDAIRLIADIGYDALEITAFDGMTGSPDALSSPAERVEVRKVIDGSGLFLGALMAGLKPERDDSAHRAQLESLMRLTELARDLAPEQPPLIQTILGGKDWEDSKTLFRDRLADWLRILADQKVDLAIKPHRGHAMSKPEEAVWLLDQLGNPRRLGMVYDYSHYAFRKPEMTIAETIETALPITRYIAVKDAVEEDGKVRFALAGESGQIDHAEIVKRFGEGGFRGDFCCEVSSQIWKSDEGYDPVEATRVCYRNLSKAFEEAGIRRV